MTHEWIFQSICCVRSRCELQAGYKKRAEKLLRIILNNCVAVLKREVDIFYLFLKM